eukprot:TRINITY_DN22039_c0_g1_i1.p1 TRINITY_DN22039_c0_g1~~TRINITY_DN22039_c0_g1_i1.p1  ORF type:complete len:110 (+),score=29.17 TRINITY_DN22039_c0_g1_i1:313-642(+)
MAELAIRAASTSYCMNFGEGSAGCALRTRQGQLFHGASISLQMGPLAPGSLSPLQTALVSMGAHAVRPQDLSSVVWVAGHGAEVKNMELADRALLMSLAPEASFTTVQV